MESLMTVNQYTKLKQVSRMTVYRQLNKGALKAFRDPQDKHWLILVDKADLVKLTAEQ